MAGIARFAYAHDAALNVVHAQDADKGCKAYTCRDCGMPVRLCYGDIVKTRHFRHKVRELAPGQHCEYRDETYAHNQAKAILQQQRWVMVPPVLPRRAEGYEGPLVPLRKAEVVRAAHVYIERTLYEDAECGLNFHRRQQPYVDEPGRRDFVCRPDVIFTNVADKPVLLIEIHVTHEVNYDKLVGLRRAQINTIEITIPWFFNAQEIQKLLASHADTKWLYNHERETIDPVGHHAPGAPPRGDDGVEEIPAPGPEPLACQLFELKQALRSLKKFVGGTAMGALRDRLADARSECAAAASREAAAGAAEIERAEGELRPEFSAAAAALDGEEAALGAEEARTAELYDRDQKRVSGKIAAVELELGAAYRAAAPALRKRVDERRAAYRDAAAAVAATQADLTRRFQQATAQLERAAADRAAATEAATATERAVQERLTRLGGYLEKRSYRTGDALARRVSELEREIPDVKRRAADLERFTNELAAAERLQAELERMEPAVTAAEAAPS